MSSELTAFFITIMNDLDDRERMYENGIKRRPEQADCFQKMLAQTQNIKSLTTNRARQFGLTVADSPEEIALRNQMGIIVADYKNLPLLQVGDFQ
ncbi:hypothetical protein [Photobacterium sp.]|uniref:hypothetical protein n=1 Tax=Photobacterium sp. TaxID=660 RepID=UPI00299F31DB|nr:hypothetical protein [Photobacterium sp.]MDX1304551.1 hypothetical protein [Photobacterium sp.]